MSISEKDAVLRDRAAALRALMELTIATREHAAKRVAELFPLPKVTRRRVVKDPHGVGEWRYTAAWSYPTVELRAQQDGDWRVTDWSLLVTKERIAVWSDLLANPTEEVEE